MAVNFEFHRSVSRFQLNMESIICKYDKAFQHDDEVDLTHLKVENDNGFLKHRSPKMYGSSRLRATKQKEEGNVSGYITGSGDVTCVSQYDKSIWDGSDGDDTLTIGPNLIRYRATDVSAHVTAIQSFRDNVLNVEENEEEPSDAETISDESDSDLNDSSEEECDIGENGATAVQSEAELNNKNLIKPQEGKRKDNSPEAESYEGDVDTEGTLSSQMSFFTSPKLKCQNLLQKVFKKPDSPLSKTTKQTRSGQPDGRVYPRTFDAARAILSTGESNSLGHQETSIPGPDSEGYASHSSGDEEIVTLSSEKEEGKPRITMNATYIVKESKLNLEQKKNSKETWHHNDSDGKYSNKGYFKDKISDYELNKRTVCRELNSVKEILDYETDLTFNPICNSTQHNQIDIDMSSRESTATLMTTTSPKIPHYLHRLPFHLQESAKQNVSISYTRSPLASAPAKLKRSTLPSNFRMIPGNIENTIHSNTDSGHNSRGRTAILQNTLSNKKVQEEVIAKVGAQTSGSIESTTQTDSLAEIEPNVNINLHQPSHRKESEILYENYSNSRNPLLSAPPKLNKQNRLKRPTAARAILVPSKHGLVNGDEKQSSLWPQAEDKVRQTHYFISPQSSRKVQGNYDTVSHRHKKIEYHRPPRNGPINSYQTESSLQSGIQENIGLQNDCLTSPHPSKIPRDEVASVLAGQSSASRQFKRSTCLQLDSSGHGDHYKYSPSSNNPKYGAYANGCPKSYHQNSRQLSTDQPGNIEEEHPMEIESNVLTTPTLRSPLQGDTSRWADKNFHTEETFCVQNNRDVQSYEISPNPILLHNTKARYALEFVSDSEDQHIPSVETMKHKNTISTIRLSGRLNRPNIADRKSNNETENREKPHFARGNVNVFRTPSAITTSTQTLFSGGSTLTPSENSCFIPVRSDTDSKFISKNLVLREESHKKCVLDELTAPIPFPMQLDGIKMNSNTSEANRGVNKVPAKEDIIRKSVTQQYLIQIPATAKSPYSDTSHTSSECILDDVSGYQQLHVAETDLNNSSRPSVRYPFPSAPPKVINNSVPCDNLSNAKERLSRKMRVGTSGESAQKCYFGSNTDIPTAANTDAASIGQQIDKLYDQVSCKQLSSLTSPQPKSPQIAKGQTPISILKRLQNMKLKTPPREPNEPSASRSTRGDLKSYSRKTTADIDAHQNTVLQDVRSASGKSELETVQGKYKPRNVHQSKVLSTQTNKLVSRACSTPRQKRSLPNDTFNVSAIIPSETFQCQSNQQKPLPASEVNCSDSLPLRTIGDNGGINNKKQAIDSNHCLYSIDLYQESSSNNGSKNTLQNENKEMQPKSTKEKLPGHCFDFREIAKVKASNVSKSIRLFDGHATSDKPVQKVDQKSSQKDRVVSCPDLNPSSSKRCRKCQNVCKHCTCVFELDSDDSDLLCKPLPVSDTDTLSDHQTVRVSRPNLFENRIKRLRSKNKQKGSARKSLAGAFCVVVSSDSDSKTKHPFPISKQYQPTTDCSISKIRREEDMDNSTYSPAPKKRRVDLMSSHSANSSMQCEGPGKCQKSFCFSCIE